DYVIVDPVLFRPAEVDVLRADASKARERLGWQATTTLEEMIHEMVEADLRRLSSPSANASAALAA
ncbi:hypothetical protein EGT07_32955, partial [Herbaspirillum sp. HC18]